LLEEKITHFDVQMLGVESAYETVMCPTVQRRLQ